MDDPPSLSFRHRQELEAQSGITPGILAQRGYISVDAAIALELNFSKDQARPGLLIPIWGVDGEIVLYQLKPDQPREKDGKPIKYETPLGAKMRLDVHPAALAQIKDPSQPLVITEGIKKGDAFTSRGIPCVSLLGVWNFSGAGEAGGICELSDWGQIPFKNGKGVGRKVYIVFDSDIVDKEGVKKAAIRLAAMCRRRGASEVLAIRLPSPDGAKIGADDYFVRGGTSEALFAAVDPMLLRLSAIRVDGRDIGEMSDDALRALVQVNDPPKVFVRAGELVEVRKDEEGRAHISEMGLSRIRGVLGRAASFYRIRGTKAVVETCPSEIAEDVRTLGQWPELPPISRVVRCPIALERHLQTAPGYCADAGVWIDSEKVQPWEGSAASAAVWLRQEIFEEFPFASESDFAHALAFCLLPIVRERIEGPTPLHLFGAPVQGTGKSLLARVCLMLTQGNQIAVTPMRGSEEEIRKHITASLLGGKSYLLFDNVKHSLDSGSLEALITGGEWEDRKLGVTQNVQIKIRQALALTANNPGLSRDLIDRSARIWLDARMEQPRDRTGLRPIERIVREGRPKIQGALCRMVQAWLDERPVWRGRTMGSFEEWSAVLGGILVCSGVAGFLENVEEFRGQMGGIEAAWRGFYERWYRDHAGKDVQVGQLLEIFREDDDLLGLIGDREGTGHKINLNRALKRRIGVVCGGMSIERATQVFGEHGGYRMVPEKERAAVRSLFEGRPSGAAVERIEVL